jgi:hypothetical protein
MSVQFYKSIDLDHIVELNSQHKFRWQFETNSICNQTCLLLDDLSSSFITKFIYIWYFDLCSKLTTVETNSVGKKTLDYNEQSLKGLAAFGIGFLILSQKWTDG